MADCPKLTGTVNKNCMAASLLLRLTPSSSGYFENVWLRSLTTILMNHRMATRRHLLKSTFMQAVVFWLNLKASICFWDFPVEAFKITLFPAGLTWFYGSSAEHSILYQYQLSNAHNIYLGHMQTETPYFQADPDPSQPYTIRKFPSDPTYQDCVSGTYCEEAYALRVIASSDILDRKSVV